MFLARRFVRPVLCRTETNAIAARCYVSVSGVAKAAEAKMAAATIPQDDVHAQPKPSAQQQQQQKPKPSAKDFTPQIPTAPVISVLGVGGAGGNTINNMIARQFQGVEFCVCNTDGQALSHSLALKRIQLGRSLTHGLGAGAKPDVGAEAAREGLEAVMSEIDGSHMVFVTAGMGGGTGTGAAPVIAAAARDAGMLTVGIVTKPFEFEGPRRMRLADAGIAAMEEVCDTLIVIPNQKLLSFGTEQIGFADAFKLVDNVLAESVRGLTDLIVMPGLINLDFADVQAVMKATGRALMGTGEAEGKGRAHLAAEMALHNPLLENVSVDGATGVLISITGGSDLNLREVDEIAQVVSKSVDDDANIIFGATFDESMHGRVRVSVIITGMHKAAHDAAQQSRVAAASPAAAAAAKDEAEAPKKKLGWW